MEIGMTLEQLARSSGALGMVAMDQRESLRAMLAEHRAAPVTDDVMREFKLEVARAVGPYASGFLIDKDLGFRDITENSLLPAGCGLILAVDDLQHVGPVVRDTYLDRAVDPAQAKSRGAVALKLLLVWRRDADRTRRVEMAAEFIALCADAGLLSVLEPVVRPHETESEFRLNAAILEAARELGPLGPSLYKAQVPDGTTTEMAATCTELTNILPMPWVVLSQGVPVADFPAAVQIACRAGASGFLAGRAIWSDTIGAGNTVELLRTRSVDRLRMLGDLVDAYARPWHAV
jgi:sulfofructosephosphate aldolase